MRKKSETYGISETIAAVSDDAGNPCALDQPCHISVYIKNGDNWIIRKNIDFKISGNEEIGTLRLKIRDAAAECDGCRAIVAGDISGIPYQIFNSLGFHIFTADAYAGGLFDAIIKDLNDRFENEADDNGFIPIIQRANDVCDTRRAALRYADSDSTLKNAVCNPGDFLKPFSPMGDGMYYFNLIKLQEKHPEISSKMSLSDFLNKADFQRLEITCRHVPPWIEATANRRGMTCVSEFSAGECRITIIKNR